MAAAWDREKLLALSTLMCNREGVSDEPARFLNIQLNTLPCDTSPSSGDPCAAEYVITFADSGETLLYTSEGFVMAAAGAKKSRSCRVATRSRDGFFHVWNDELPADEPVPEKEMNDTS